MVIFCNASLTENGIIIMETSRRHFIKKSILGTVALGAALPSVETVATTTAKKRKKAKRIVLLSLDGICVAGFQQAKTPNLDALLAEGVSYRRVS